MQAESRSPRRFPATCRAVEMARWLNVDRQTLDSWLAKAEFPREPRQKLKTRQALLALGMTPDDISEFD